jgi:hypothetical protein
MSDPRPEHPDDLLSAHVDGELDEATAAEVAAHVEACASCRTAERELLEARALLRSLPPVDGAPVIEGFLGRHRRVVRLGAAFVGVAAVALAALGATASTRHDPVRPDLAALTAAHEESAHADLDGVDRRIVGAGYDAPPGLIGSSVRLSRHEAYDGTDLAAVVYRDGDLVVSVYQQPGRVDWDELPPGDRTTMGDHQVWFGRDTPVVAVAEKGDLVVTVISDERAAVLTAVGGLPEWKRQTTWDRVHDACQRLTQVFALGG